jgi:hypothetical protein
MCKSFIITEHVLSIAVPLSSAWIYASFHAHGNQGCHILVTGGARAVGLSNWGKQFTGVGLGTFEALTSTMFGMAVHKLVRAA